MQYRYKTQGTCSREIIFDVENDVIKDIQFVGGCDGNLKAISALVKNRPVEEVAQMLAGITCGYKPTSCPDQLAKALLEIKQADGAEKN